MGPWTDSLNIFWELVESAHSSVPPQPAESESLGVRPGHVPFNKPCRWFKCTLKFENHCLVVLVALASTCGNPDTTPCRCCVHCQAGLRQPWGGVPGSLYSWSSFLVWRGWGNGVADLCRASLSFNTPSQLLLCILEQVIQQWVIPLNFVRVEEMIWYWEIAAFPHTWPSSLFIHHLCFSKLAWLTWFPYYAL